MSARTPEEPKPRMKVEFEFRVMYFYSETKLLIIQFLQIKVKISWSDPPSYYDLVGESARVQPPKRRPDLRRYNAITRFLSVLSSSFKINFSSDSNNSLRRSMEKENFSFVSEYSEKPSNGKREYIEVKDC